MKKASFISSIAAATLLTTSLGASAAAMIDNKGRVSVAIDTAGLNLQTSEGQEILYNRLKRAATEICGSRSIRKVGSTSRVQENRACYKETLSNAVEATGIKPLQELHTNS